MTDYCAFSQNHQCLKWQDYQLTRHKLEEADETCRNNWIEMEYLRSYIDRLQAILRQHGIDVPPQ